MIQPYLKISVVTPSYNQAKYLDETIKSVINQNYPNFEHIIFDNNSTDGTIDILKKYTHLICVSEPDKGQSDALNKGFKMATGDIIGWLNADDRYITGCFEAVCDFFRAHPDCDVLYGDCRWIDTTSRVIQTRRELDFDFFILKHLHFVYIPTASTFFRRRIFDEGNWLNFNYRYAMDYDFFLRLALKGYRFGHLNKFLADFRWHTGNKSLAVREANKEHVVVILQQDHFLRSLPRMFQRPGMLFFMSLAFLKRYWQKVVKGFYIFQWQT